MSSQQRAAHSAAMPPTQPPLNTALREIAGRLQKLSYRDMRTLAEAISVAHSDNPVGVGFTVKPEDILAAADALAEA